MVGKFGLGSFYLFIYLDTLRYKYLLYNNNNKIKKVKKVADLDAAAREGGVVGQGEGHLEGRGHALRELADPVVGLF